MQAGTYSSGITIEHRGSWRDGLYVSENSPRFWDVGSNYRRWNGIQKIINNPTKETKKSRTARAAAKYGKMSGPPVICRYMKKFPQVLKIRCCIPTMHTKIHFVAYAMSPTLHHMKVTRAAGFRTLVRRFDGYRDSLSNGTLCTNATGLFELSKRYEMFKK